MSVRLRSFLVLWFGQTVSQLGSAMTRFALIIWIWETTGEATPLALVTFFSTVPGVLANLIAGQVVDRFNRKTIIMVSDLGAGLSTVLLLLLLSGGQLQLWHLYLTGALAGIFGTFQSLAFFSSVTLLVDKSDYARANSLMGLSGYIAMIGAPLFGGLLLSVIDLPGIMLIDIVTFLFAVGTVALMSIPQPDKPQRQTDERKSFWSDTAFGFRYIFARPGLTGLLMVLFAFGSAEAIGYPLLSPMILARTDGDEAVLGTVQAVMGIGGILGGIWISAWGGPKRKIHGLLIGVILTGLLGDALLGLGQSLPVWLMAGFCVEFFIPLAISSNNAIWQTVVAPEVQGRVFAARGLMLGFSEPIAILASGVLADRVFEPFMQLRGAAEGEGIALLLVISGVLVALVGIGAYFVPAVRKVEGEGA
jgi:MFS transporter, DHA3 family, macrolide efflux protein